MKSTFACADLSKSVPFLCCPNKETLDGPIDAVLCLWCFGVVVVVVTLLWDALEAQVGIDQTVCVCVDFHRFGLFVGHLGIDEKLNWIPQLW